MPKYECFAEQDGNNAPHIVWKNDDKDGYKLVELAQANGFNLDLPGIEQVFGFDELLEKNNVLIFSESSDGRMNFLHDYQKFLDKKGCPWLSVKGNDWNRDIFGFSNDFEGYADIPLSTHAPLRDLLSIVENLGNAEMALAQKTHDLKTWLKNNKERQVVLIFRDISALGPTLATEIGHVFRQVFDGAASGIKLSVLILDTSSWAFLDAAEASGYAPLCYQYRLPFLCNKEIGELLKFYQLSYDDEILDRVFDQTGGQLLLVQDCLRRLSLDDDKTLTLKAVNKTIKNMRNNPPGSVKKWQIELGKILDTYPELVKSLRAYVNYHSISAQRFPPPSQELPLFLAGWLKTNRLGCWAITSSLHADLANDVLNAREEKNHG